MILNNIIKKSWKNSNHLFLLLISVCLSFICSCQSENSGKTSIPDQKKQAVTVTKNFRLEKPESNTRIKPGEEVQIRFKLLNEDIAYDSIRIHCSNIHLGTLKGQMETRVIFPGMNTGNRRIRYEVFEYDSIIEKGSGGIVILSDIVPVKMKYRVIGTYPHDTKAFTQGFEYDKGFIYEGTGNYGESSIRKYELETGEIIKFRSLSADLFGEGITRFDGKVYQITYRSQVGFVYDENNFELIRKIYYQNREGWGLTNNGKDILMSDGSNIIYFMDPEFFSVNDKIEVYDNEGPVDQLNELELVGDELYANRYLTEEIVVIDPETGKVKKRIDMTGLLKDEDKHARVDVLNGIAYNPQNSHFLVTGKYWPKIFEVIFY